MTKPLHKVVGSLVEEDAPPHCTVFRSPECGGEHVVPLHFSSEGTNETEFCEVDIAIVKKGEVQVIIEIEESNTKPVQVFGKLMASAMSSYLSHKKEGILFPIADSVVFIQILDTSKLKPARSSKPRQWELVERSIIDILRSVETNVAEYKLMVGDSLDFKSGAERARLRKSLERALG